MSEYEEQLKAMIKVLGEGVAVLRNLKTEMDGTRWEIRRLREELNKSPVLKVAPVPAGSLVNLGGGPLGPEG